MRSVEKTGRTVDEAVQEALQELGVDQASVDIEVLEEPTKGLFGFLGGRQAKVRVTLKETGGDDEVVTEDSLEAEVVESESTVDTAAAREAGIERARAFVQGVAERLGLAISIETREGDENIVHLDISGDNVGLIIGRHGQTLDAIQYLANVVANQESAVRIRVVIDAEGYRVRREETLRSLAERTAARVIAQGKKATLDPMSALERRVVHLALQGAEGVITYSEGEDPYRRVVIAPKE